MSDLIDRQAAINAISCDITITGRQNAELVAATIGKFADRIKALPSVQPKQRYTEKELSVFAHGISLSLLSKRSAQHWQYDEDTATEIEFLERLYDKVSADMKRGQDG